MRPREWAELRSIASPVLFETLIAQALAATPAAAAPMIHQAPKTVCPADTRLVEGVHYEYVQRLCTSWNRGHCYSFLPGLVALEPQATPIRVCMDEHEWPNREGARPRVMIRYVEAEQACAQIGKRLCTEFEWELACEGPETTPWPYGHAYEKEACNTSKDFMPYSEEKLNAEEKRIREIETYRLYQGEVSGSRPKCTSSFGVKDLVGNVEEWVTTSRRAWRYRSSLKGGYWSKPWAHCRGTNDSHGPQFRYYETGFRCCADPQTTRAATYAENTVTAPETTRAP